MTKVKTFFLYREKNRKEFSVTLRKAWCYVFFLLFIGIAFSFSTNAASATEITAPVIVSYSFAQENSPEKNVIVAVWIEPHEGYHIYAHRPSVATRPTTLTVSSAQGVIGAIPTRYLEGKPKIDPLLGGQQVMVYEGKTPIFLQIPKQLAGHSLRISITMLLCSHQHCWPETYSHSLVLPAWTNLAPLQQQPWSALFAEAQQSSVVADAMPLDAFIALLTSSSKKQLAVVGSLENSKYANQSTPLQEVDAGTAPQQTTQHSISERSLQQTASQMTLDSSQDVSQIVLEDSSQDAVVNGLPHIATDSLQPTPELATAAKPIQWTFAPRYVVPSLEVTGLTKALLLGLLAGLILNLMPCVLPVVGFKISAFIMASGDTRHEKERVRAFREHNIFFALGIIAWFLCLAFVLTWADLTWGQVFQQQEVVFFLLLLVFLLALSMFGVFSLPVLDLKAGNSENPRFQAFVTGAVATLLATPCSGPLLGGVLGWAFGQTPFILAVVFSSVGLGMALPYVLFSIWPNLVRFMPKSGMWTGLVEQIVGFFLIGTALYLFSILAESLRYPTLVTLFVASFGAWSWGVWGGFAVSTTRRFIVRGVVIIAIALSSVWTLMPAPAEPPVWDPFHAESLQALLGREPLVVEFTADWCPNCKVIEKTTLTAKNILRWKKEYGARFIQVDLTHDDAQGQALLRSLGSGSIPLIALFPTGILKASPFVLRDIVTTSQMETALQRAFPHKEVGTK